MKIFEYEYPWTTHTNWLLPAGEEMMQAQFKILDEQVQAVLEHVSDHRVCVQAGGAFGMYPLRLAYYFHRVHTWEPVIENFSCLVENIEPHRVNIEARHAALMDYCGGVGLGYSKPKRNSYGAHHVDTSPDKEPEVECFTLDSYELEHVDLIWLDIEGAEVCALRGARTLIDLQRPVIVIEERALPGMRAVGTRVGEARQFLRKYGYKLAGRTHGDLIFTP